MEGVDSSLDVVVPVYMGEKFLQELTDRILSTGAQMGVRVRIIYVCDDSPDGSWQEILRLGEDHQEVQGLLFTRNRGQHAAILAGIHYSTGQLVAVMDCDLQDAPEDLKMLTAALSPNIKIAAAAPNQRGTSAFGYRAMRGLYHRVHKLVNAQSTEMRSLSFLVMTNDVAQTLRRYREADRHFSGFLLDSGYSIAYVPTEYRTRPQGSSSYNFRKRGRLALSGLIFHSNYWIVLAVVFGLSLSAIAFLLGFGLAVVRLSGATFDPGWTSVIVLLLFSLGLIVFGLGMVALYVSQVLIEVRARPHYVVEDAVNVPRLTSEQ